MREPLYKSFGRNNYAVVKEWTAPPARGRVSEAYRTISSPDRPYSLYVRAGNFISPNTDRSLPLKSAADYIAETIVDNGWEGCDFDVLATKLTQTFNELDAQAKEAFAELEVVLLRFDTDTPDNAEYRGVRKPPVSSDTGLPLLKK